MIKSLLLAAAAFLLLPLPALAQDEEADQPTIQQIALETVVEDTITDRSFFDWWQVQLSSGDILEVQMLASDGLVPLLGLLSSGGDLLARSDDEGPAEMDGTVVLTFTVEEGGLYTIVATRDGNDRGTSTGRYVLRASCINCGIERPNPYHMVEFRCGEDVAVTAFTISFMENHGPPGSRTTPIFEFYRLTVYGIDGFQPVIRALAEIQETPLDCSDDGSVMPGNSYTLPGQPPATVTEDDLPYMAQLTLQNISTTDLFGEITFTVGSKNGAPGRYMAVLEGMSISSRSDHDALIVRLGPLARYTEMLVYMVADAGTRLDPYMQLYEEGPLEDDHVPVACDDAGGRGCEHILPFTGAGTTIMAGEGRTIVGDRFDAGLLLAPGHPDPNVLLLSSRDNRTSGGYSLVFIGELPPRPAGE